MSIIPSSLSKEEIEESDFKKWLSRRALAHFRRDGNPSGLSIKKYSDAIYDAVDRCKGEDEYLRNPLSWELIGKYRGEDSKNGGRAYRVRFWNLPTIDHADPTTSGLDFRICSWKMNDFKGDMKEEELVEYCIKFLKEKGYQITITQPESAPVN